MVSHIKAVNPNADIVMLNYDSQDSAVDEVENMKLWLNENRMFLSMEKTSGMMVVESGYSPSGLHSLNTEEWLKLLGVTMEEIPGK